MLRISGGLWYPVFRHGFFMPSRRSERAGPIPISFWLPRLCDILRHL